MLFGAHLCYGIHLIKATAHFVKKYLIPPDIYLSFIINKPVMKMQKTAILLTVVNAVLLMGIMAQNFTAHAQPQQTIAPMLRGRGLEIVDSFGKLRASITVQPQTNEGGKMLPGTVVLRLIDGQGGPVIKIDASERGGGFNAGDESNDYIQIVARGTGSFIKISQKGKEQVIKQE